MRTRRPSTSGAPGQVSSLPLNVLGWNVWACPILEARRAPQALRPYRHLTPFAYRATLAVSARCVPRGTRAFFCAGLTQCARCASLALRRAPGGRKGTGMAEYAESLFQEITETKKRAFLAAYAHTGRITQAARSAQVNWRNHYNWLHADATYAKAFRQAQQMAGDWLEDEAIRRAKEGVLRPIHYKGAHTDDVVEFSDTLLIFLLKGAKPEKYRDNVHVQQEVSGDVTVTWTDRLARSHTALEERRNGHPLPT